MNLLEVYNIFYQKLAVLNDNTTGCAKNISEEFKDNEVNIITFDLPVDSTKWQYVINENLVTWKGEYYVIKDTNFAHSKDKKSIVVQCKHLSYSLETITRNEVEDIGYSADVLIKSQLGYQKILDANGDWTGTFQEDTNVYPTDTGWLFGGTDIDSSVCRSVESKEQSVFTNLRRIAELFTASLVFESDYVDVAHNHKRVVSLKQNVLDRGTQIRVGKNLQSVNVHYDTSEIVTKLYPFGGTDDVTDQEVSILGALDKNSVEVTNNWIEDYSYYKNKYPALTNEYIVAHPELFLHELTWRVEEYKTPQELYDEAIKKMAIISQPKVTCTVEGLDLSSFPEYFINSPIIGETITIIDEDLNLMIKAKVVSISRNNSNPLAMTVTITNEVEYTSIVKQLVDSSATIDKVTTPLKQIKGQYIKEASIDDASIKNLTAEKIDAGDISTDRMKANVVEAVNTTTTEAKIQLAKIEQITAGSAFIAEGAIGSAQIGDLSADKFRSGTIDTAVVTVQGTNGRLKIKGNRLQVFDDNGGVLFERVALGDINADGTVYGFRVRGTDGTTLLITEDGVTKEGFTDGYNKLDDGTLDGKKLDIATVVTAINNGVTTITGSKVMLTDKTLDVAISEINSTQTNQGTTINNQTALISSMSNEITLKASQEDLNKVNDTLTDYETKITSVTTKADGVVIDVQDLKSRVSNNETDLQNLDTYFDFNVSGLTIGKTGSPLNITISNAEMDFIDNGKVVAYVNGQKMYITSLEVLSQLIVGVHKIEKYNSDVSLVRWVGGAS